MTSANTLLALFAEARSPAARLLGEQGVYREHAAAFIAHSIGKGAGSATRPVAAAMKGRFDAATSERKYMRRSLSPLLLASVALLAAGAAFAAELEIPPHAAPEDVSVQKGPPNCRRWTDECVNCSRGAEGDAPVCSNIGFACQPKLVRCLSPAVSHSEPRKK